MDIKVAAGASAFPGLRTAFLGRFPKERGFFSIINGQFQLVLGFLTLIHCKLTSWNCNKNELQDNNKKKERAHRSIDSDILLD